MTWGSNASYDTIPCRFCGADMIDDKDSGPTTHEMTCVKRTLSRRFWHWLKSW